MESQQTSRATQSEQRTTPAPLWRRFTAMFYDILLVISLLFLVTALALGINPPEGEGEYLQGPFYQLALLATILLYFAGFWRVSGQTPGMRAWGVRVELRSGGYPALKVGLLRCAGAVISLACLGLGYWSALLNRERICWHEHWSGTRTVLLPQKSAKTPPQEHKPPQQ